jgi:hypothetical protein
MDFLVKTVLRLLHAGTSVPVQGCKVKLYDKDLFADDFLGEAQSNANGEVEIIFDPRVVSSNDSPGEIKPDIYFVVEKDGAQVFKSQLWNDVDLERLPSDLMSRHNKLDLGTFLI